MKLKIDISIRVSRIVKIFILSDFFLLSGWGMIGPIFSIFIIENIQNATLFTVGLAASIYWITKSLIQIPIANALDKARNERISFYVLMIGLTLGAMTAFLFILISEIWHLYVLELLHALAFGLYAPAWSGLFSHHLDKNHYSLDWSLDSTAIGIAAGITGVIGGALANWFGFTIVFLFGGILTLVAAGALLTAPQLIFPKKHPWRHAPKDHSPLTMSN